MHYLDGPPSKYNIYTAGIIPAFDNKSISPLLNPCVTLPIAENFTPLHNSVLECAIVGCSNIWIVCPGEHVYLFRKIIGDHILNPNYSISQSKNRDSNSIKKEIPIYYVPIRPLDRERRDSIPWTIIHGARLARYTSKKLSKWLVPHVFYVSFPMGLYDPFFLLSHKKHINQHADNNLRFYVSYENETVRDGKYLGFSFYTSDFFDLKKNIVDKSTNMYYTDAGHTTKLSLEDRYSGKNLSLEDVFDFLPLDNSVVAETKNYCSLNCWQSYQEYMKSDMTEIFSEYGRWAKKGELLSNSFFKKEKKDFQMRPFGRKT